MSPRPAWATTVEFQVSQDYRVRPCVHMSVSVYAHMCVQVPAETRGISSLELES